MATRQELMQRHQMAEEARRRLKSGEFNQPQTAAQGYQTRQQLIDAYNAEHPAPPPDTSTFQNIPQFKPQMPAPTEPVMKLQQDLRGTIPNMQQSAIDAFTPKPVDSTLLPSNNTVRASGPKPTNPIVAGYDQLVHGMQTAIGFQQQPTNQVPSTGITGLDKFLRGTGEFLPGLGSGAPTGGGLASETSSAVQRVGSNLTPKVVSSLAKASPEAAYGVQQAAPVATRIASHAIGAGAENAVIGAAAGQTDTNQVAANFVAGGALGGAGSALKEAAMPLLTKAARGVVNKYKPAAKPAPTNTDTLALPLGRADSIRAARGGGAQTPDVITPDYTFKLPIGDEYGAANRAAAAEDLQTIKQEIAHLNGRYEAAVNAEFKYLQDTAKQGVDQGQLHFDETTGDVVGRTGRQSNNEKWYRDFYAEHGRAPSKKEMMTLARQRVENGFQIDDAGNMTPSWLEENEYHNTMEALTSVRDHLTKSLNQAESKSVVTDATLGGKELAFKRPQAKAAEPLKPKQELPKAKATPKPNDAIAKLDKETKEYKASLEQSVKDGIRTREEADKQIKGLAMRSAAERRRIIQGDSLIPVDGGLTGKELADKIAKMKSNHVGKEVIVDGKKGTITKMSFGKVGVKFADGSESFHAPENVKPAIDVDAVIKKQQAPKAEPKKADPLKPKQELPKKSKAEPKRSNFKTMAEAEGLSPELKKEIAKSDDRYEPITNKETVATADASITKKGVQQSVIDFLSRDSTDAGHIAEGYRLMQILDARAQHEAAAKVAAKVAADLTKAGQQAQAGRIIKRLSPEGQMLALARKAEASGKEVTPKDAKDFAEAAKAHAETANAEGRTNAMQDILDALEAGKAPTKDDIRALESSIERAKKFLPDEKPKAKKPTPAKTKRDKVLATMQEAEEEAWERIKARRNIGFTPGKGNEMVDWSIIAANRVAKGTIKASNHVEQIVKLFGEDVRPIATKIYNKSLKHVARHPELKAIKKNISTAEQLVEQWAKKTSTSHADLKKVRELAESLGKLEGKEGKKADEQMQMIMAKYEKSSITDKIQALRFMDMLGNTGTQLLNASSNIAMASLKNTTDIFGAMIDSSISSILKKPRTTTAMGMAPWKFTWELLKNMREGGRANWKGISPAGLHSVSEIHGLAFSKKWGPLNWAERSLRAVAGGADYGIYKAQFDNEILKQARLAAKKVPGAERAKFIRDFKANPPSEALEIADNVGKETTFQQANSLGDLAAGIPNRLGNIKGKGRIPGKMLEQGIRAVVPFIRTPFNILETGVSLTPGGLLRGTVELIMAKTPSAQRQAISHLSLGITGTGLTAAGYYLHKIGIITDANDSGNKNLDEVRAEAGRGAYRFNQSGMLRYLGAIMGGEDIKTAEKAAAYKEGDRTFNYNKLQPIAFPVALGAGFEKGGVSGGLTQGVGSLLAMSSLKSIQDVVSTGYSGSEGEKQLGVVNRVVESYLKSFSPSLLAQEARREDTTQRQTSFNKGLKADLGDYYKSRMPSAGSLVPNKLTSKSLPAKVTPLGQTKLGPSGIAENYANPYQSNVQQYSKAAAIIADLIDRTGSDSIAPSAPAKKIKGVAIPPKRYEQYQRDIGNEITTKILAVNADLSDEKKVKKIAQIISDTKSKYADKLRREMGIK